MWASTLGPGTRSAHPPAARTPDPAAQPTGCSPIRDMESVDHGAPRACGSAGRAIGPWRPVSRGWGSPTSRRRRCGCSSAFCPQVIPDLSAQRLQIGRAGNRWPCGPRTPSRPDGQEHECPLGGQASPAVDTVPARRETDPARSRPSEFRSPSESSTAVAPALVGARDQDPWPGHCGVSPQHLFRGLIASMEPRPSEGEVE